MKFPPYCVELHLVVQERLVLLTSIYLRVRHWTTKYMLLVFHYMQVCVSFQMLLLGAWFCYYVTEVEL